jgi:hypothetical protein
MQGSWYCLEGCLESAVTETLRRLGPVKPSAAFPRRVPLGLLLLSRQELTVEQLRRALGTQRAAGRGKIGEWIQVLGFASELQVTAALARQCSCPVLQGNSFPRTEGRIPLVPLALLESFLMVPIDYIPATATLHVAFSDRVDYTVLYAIEQMLACRTEPCLAPASVLRQYLQARAERRTRNRAGNRAENEVVFDRVTDAAEIARIVRNYAIRVSATELRLVRCGPHVWVRLHRATAPALDLILRSPADLLLFPSAPRSSAPGSAWPATV